MPEVESYDRPTKLAITTLISTLSTFWQACLGAHASDAENHINLSSKSTLSTSSFSPFYAYSVNESMHIALACTFTLSAPLHLYSCYQNQISTLHARSVYMPLSSGRTIWSREHLWVLRMCTRIFPHRWTRVTSKWDTDRQHDLILFLRLKVQFRSLSETDVTAVLRRLPSTLFM